MMNIREYIYMMHELIEKPRNELRIKAIEQNDEYCEMLLAKYEKVYRQKCLEIEKKMSIELRNIKRFKQVE